MDEITAVNKNLPEIVKQAVLNYQTEKIGAARMGCSEVTLDKIAEHAGAMLIARRRRWRPITEGLVALAHLQK